jgi:uncharacterized damage-inducible protein DinB
MQTLQHQYQLVKSSREVVLSYCEAMLPQHYTTQVENFGRGGTIRQLQMHTANTYLHWLLYFGMKQQPTYYDYESNDISTVAAMRTVFDKVNQTVEEFLAYFEADYFTKVTNIIPSTGKESTIEALTLFTHVTMHEFHHKGQIMSMGRILGYTPPDADIIRL